MGSCDEVLVEVLQESEHLGDSGRGRKGWRDLFGQEWLEGGQMLLFSCVLLVLFLLLRSTIERLKTFSALLVNRVARVSIRIGYHTIGLKVLLIF